MWIRHSPSACDSIPDSVADSKEFGSVEGVAFAQMLQAVVCYLNNMLQIVTAFFFFNSLSTA